MGKKQKVKRMAIKPGERDTIGGKLVKNLAKLAEVLAGKK